jgi:hypothetical protein
VAVNIDVDDLKNCMMASSMMNINFNEFNWKDSSGWLCRNYGDSFDSWWDKSRFNYKNGSGALIEHCSYHFFRWWDPYKIKLNDTNRRLLCEHCPKHFEMWWTEPHNSRLWDSLIIYCPDHFDKWWDPETFIWRSYGNLLKQHCADKQHIWGQDYIIHQLNSEDEKIRWNR